jgi:AcrR family transcriptional regulator
MPPVAAAIVEYLSTIGQVTVLDGRVGKAASDRRRQSILDAALERFTTVGYGPTTVAEIRQRARVTTGSLYHYFPRGKADVAAAVHLDCLRRYQDPFLPCLDAAGGDAESGVRGAVRYHLEWIAANPWRARFLFSERPAEVRDGLRGGLAALNRDFFARVGEWLDRHVAAGALRPLPAQALYALWIGPAQQVGRQLLDGDLRVPLDDAIDILGDGAWRALRREQAGGT